MSSKTAITVKDLQVAFDDNLVIENASFTIETGEFIYVLGGNGSGKTTLIKAITGLVPIRSGSIDIFGKTNSSEVVSQHIGYVPQYTKIDKSFPITVSEMIELECHTSGSCDIGAGGHLKIFNAEKLAKRKINQLSGGEFQKVLLARAMVTDPDILILDEPTNNLDRDTQQSLFTTLHKLAEEQAKTIILITHDHNLVEGSQHQVLFLQHGKVHANTSQTIIDQHIHI